MCTEDMDKLSRHREMLMAKCSEAEDNNSQLRSELRANKLLLVSNRNQQNQEILIPGWLITSHLV